MNKKRKINIMVFTGQRSDFSILKPVINDLKNNSSFNMKLVVTGSHLSANYGMTESEIKDQKISIYKKINMLKKGNDEVSALKSNALPIAPPLVGSFSVLHIPLAI